MELGLFSFAEVPPHGTTRSRLRELVEEAALADAVGLDVFGVGEHHRPDYAASAPAVVLAAIAARTERIRLTSAVTVLSSDDPVRVFQQFATLDQLADGRAEILVGRGSFTESFPLFGQALQDYDTLFSEKLDLLLRLRESERVTWSGRHRPSLSGQGVYPRPCRSGCPSGSPSAARPPRSSARGGWGSRSRSPSSAASLTASARSSTSTARPAPRRATTRRRFGCPSTATASSPTPPRTPPRWPWGRSWRRWAASGASAGGRRRRAPSSSRRATLDGALVLGSAQQAIDKILYQHELFGHDRHLLQLTVGPLPHAEVLRAIEIFGQEVAPVVRREVAASAVG